MFSTGIKVERMDDSPSTSITDPNSLSSPLKIIGSSASNYLVEQCELLIKNNFVQYDKYIKLRDDLRLRLIETNEDYKHLISCLEKANEDALKLKLNNDCLAKICEIVSKNNFVKELAEIRERLQLKFFKLLIHCENLKASLNAVDGDIKLLKLENQELFKLQTTSTEESLEYAKHQKTLRMKSIEDMCECERLDARLNEACEEIEKMKAEHDDLIRRYEVLSQDAIVKEFVENFTNSVDSTMEPVKNLNSSECLESFVIDDVASSGSRIYELENLLTTERRQREQMEKKYNSLEDFSDKLCHLLHKYQLSRLPDRMTENYSKNLSIGSLMPIEPTLSNTKNLADPSPGTDQNFLVIGRRRPGRPPSKNKNKQFSAIKPSNVLRKRLSLSTNRCDVCGRYCSSPVTLNYHKLVAHEGFKPYECTVCNKRFGREDNLKTHVVTHSEVRPHGCSICPKRFKLICNLRWHEKIIHNKYHEEVEKRLEPLENHVTQSESGPYECSTCQRRFRLLCHLRSHEQTLHNDTSDKVEEIQDHLGNNVDDPELRPHECSVCQKRFKLSHHLKKHQKWHTKGCTVDPSSRPYECSICQRRFKLAFHLALHERYLHKGGCPAPIQTEVAVPTEQVFVKAEPDTSETNITSFELNVL